MTIRCGWPEHERIQYLREIRPIEGKSHPIEFQGLHQYMPIYRVPIDLPRYRLNNMRTMALQDECVQVESLALDFFSADPESDNVHLKQHNLLSQLTSEAGLDAKFENATVTQNEPLIITYEGFVANGNRRLTAWRNLYNQDPSTYAHYANVDVDCKPYEFSKWPLRWPGPQPHCAVLFKGFC